MDDVKEGGQMMSDMNQALRRIRPLTALLLCMALHVTAFLLLIRGYGLSYGTRLEHFVLPDKVLYFSSNHIVNQTLYVVFYPWVELTLLARTHMEFAHTDALLAGVSPRDTRGGCSPAGGGQVTPGRALAPVIWAAGAVALLRRRSKRRGCPVG